MYENSGKFSKCKMRIQLHHLLLTKLISTVRQKRSFFLISKMEIMEIENRLSVFFCLRSVLRLHSKFYNTNWIRRNNSRKKERKFFRCSFLKRWRKNNGNIFSMHTHTHKQTQQPFLRVMKRRALLEIVINKNFSLSICVGWNLKFLPFLYPILI